MGNRTHQFLRPMSMDYSAKLRNMFFGDIYAYYPLWDVAGQVASDISGNERHAYINGGVTLGDGGIGDGRPSMLFNGTTGYISGLGILAGTNLPINPVFGVDTSDWTNAGFATMERSLVVARFGTASLRLYDAAVATADKVSNGFMAVTAGTTYSMSQWVKKTICTGTGRLLIDWYTAGDVYISSSAVALTAGTHDWQMYSVSAAAPGTAAKAKVALDGNGLTAGTEFEAYIDGVNFTASTLPLWHIDGTQPGCAWTGAAHASTSVRTEAFSGAAGTLAAWVKIPAGVWTDGAERRIVRLYADANNQMELRRSNVNNTLFGVYSAAGVYETQAGTEYGGITNWLHVVITWDKAAEQVKYYVNGVQWGSTDTALGVWAGALDPSQTIIGALSNALYFHSGNIAHVLLLNRAATAGEVREMANPGGSFGRVSVATPCAYDAFTASLVHVYEPARRVLSSYTGALVRLRRASDNAEANWGYDADNNLPVDAIAAWAGGAAYIVTVYDQKTGDAVTQAVAGSQPLYAASAQNGHAGMSFDGTADYLQGAFTSGGILSQPVSMFAVAQLDAANVNDGTQEMMIDGDDLVGRMAMYTSSSASPDAWAIYAGTPLVSATGDDSAWHVWSILWNGASSRLWTNGASIATGQAGSANADGLTIGSKSDASQFWKGYVNSVIICDPALSDADRVLMQNAINAYWAVY